MQYIISKKYDFNNYNNLNLNEFTFDHNTKIINKIKESINNKLFCNYSNIYHENMTKLITKICEYNNNIHNSDEIIITAGSDDGLEYITNTYINKSTNVLFFTPSYNYFEVLLKRKTNNIHYIPLDFNNDNNIGIIDCMEFYEPIMTKNSIVYIVNPNNPLGIIIKPEIIEEMLIKYPDTMFIIDEAYIDFIINMSVIFLIKKYTNIIVTRTFSKAFGLAGMRLGYLLSSTHNINNINILYNEKNVTDIAKISGYEVLNSLKYYKDLIEIVNILRNEFQNFLKELGIYYVESYGNFISFYVGKNHNTFLNILEKQNIYIRNRNNQHDMNGFVRITIGQSEIMNTVKNIIRENIEIFDKNPLIKYYTPKTFIWKLKILLKKFITIINNSELKNKIWLDSGSLLGVFRHNGGIIPWDNDIDFAILNNDLECLLSLKNIFLENGMRLRLNRTKCYYQIDFISDGDNEYINEHHIDIFIFNIKNGILINTDPRFVENDDYNCNFKYEENDVFPLIQYSFYNIYDVNVPRNIYNILKKNILSDFQNEICLMKDEKRLYYKYNENILFA
jgi:histidinol-phosphate aminotransferase